MLQVLTSRYKKKFSSRAALASAKRLLYCGLTQRVTFLQYHLMFNFIGRYMHDAKPVKTDRMANGMSYRYALCGAGVTLGNARSLVA